MIRQDVFTLPEGDLTFCCPDNLSAESADFMHEWLMLVSRKIGRVVIRPEVAQGNEIEKAEALLPGER